MTEKYTFTTRFLHGLSALLIMALFISGWILVDLDYYSTWYVTLPELHKVTGVILMLLWLIMIIRLFLPKKPLAPINYKTHEAILATIIKWFFYIFVTVIIVCGYLITTADGKTQIIFGWLKLPAISHFSADQIDTIGWLHENLSYVLMILVCLHVLGALKHHFIDRDATLKRML